MSFQYLTVSTLFAIHAFFFILFLFLPFLTNDDFSALELFFGAAGIAHETVYISNRKPFDVCYEFFIGFLCHYFVSLICTRLSIVGTLYFLFLY